MANPETNIISTKIIVSQESMDSDDPYDVVDSNISVINAFFERYIGSSEISLDSMRSYYADYFLAQVNNGGFSQFVYNSRWSDVVDFVTDGLRAMGAHRHLELFEQASAKVAALGSDGLERYLSTAYWDENPDRDSLGGFDEQFYALQDSEDLVALNSAWLRQHADLLVLPRSEIVAELDRIAATVTDMDGRIAAARAREPRYTKIIRALCAEAGHELDRITAGDPTGVYNGQQLLAWHFLTDHGHHRMFDVDGVAVMLVGTTDDVVCQIAAD